MLFVPVQTDKVRGLYYKRGTPATGDVTGPWDLDFDDLDAKIASMVEQKGPARAINRGNFDVFQRQLHGRRGISSMPLLSSRGGEGRREFIGTQPAWNRQQQ